MKISIIIQRYGEQINGGAELHAKFLAEKLSKKHQVTVLTTQATNYKDWANTIQETKENINNVQVFRFSSKKKNQKKSRAYRRIVTKTHKFQEFLKKIKLNYLSNILFNYEPSTVDFNKWLEYQGPFCEGLIDYLKKNKDNYNIFIFFTYLYYPTNVGLPIVANKSILIPTAHDEKTFYIKGYQNIFKKAQFIMYNSLSEKTLVENTYPNKTDNDTAGVGIDPYTLKITNFKPAYEYVIYIGRIDTSKNVKQLISWFESYTKSRKKIKLVLVGKNVSNLTGNENVNFVGFVSEDEKYQWLSQAKALIIPSLYESLSMVTLEAMAQGIPVIANANCHVLNDHITHSKAGYSYLDYKGFEKNLNNLFSATEEDLKKMGENGVAYINKHYKWEGILEKFEAAFKTINRSFINTSSKL